MIMEDGVGMLMLIGRDDGDGDGEGRCLGLLYVAVIIIIAKSHSARKGLFHLTTPRS